jgi:starch synthase
MQVTSAHGHSSPAGDPLRVELLTREDPPEVDAGPGVRVVYPAWELRPHVDVLARSGLSRTTA